MDGRMDRFSLGEISNSFTHEDLLVGVPTFIVILHKGIIHIMQGVGSVDMWQDPLLIILKPSQLFFSTKTPAPTASVSSQCL